MKALKNNILKQYYSYLFGLLILCLLFGSAAVNVCFGLLCFFFLTDVKKQKQKTLDLVLRSPFTPLFLWVVYVYLCATFVGVLTEKRFQLLYLLPVLVVLGTKLKSAKWVSLFFVASTVLVCLSGWVRTLAAASTNRNSLLKEGAQVNELLLIERPYLGFICLISIVLSAYLAKLWPRFSMYFGLVVIFLSVYIVFISARLSFGILLLLSLIYFLGYARLSAVKKTLSIGIALLFMALSFGVSSTLSDRFLLDSLDEMPLERLKDYEPRVLIWSCAYDIIQTGNFSPLVGMVSTERLTEQLVACYAQDQGNEERRAFFIDSRFNTHNQYVDLYLTTGIIGLALFVWFLLQLLIVYRKNFFATALLVATAGFFVTENVLYRQLGVYLLGLVFVFIYHFSQDKNDTIEEVVQN